jgi:cation diffusion facilitator CzcD-associated flavoprotein CzcO
MRFPAPAHAFPSAAEMADYLEAYTARFELPVHCGVAVDAVERRGGRYLVSAGARRWEADNVVVATGSFRDPYVPAFAADLDPAIRQLHSSEYRSPAQLRDGLVLVVGAAHSGADIAHEVAERHATVLGFRNDYGWIRFPLPIGDDGFPRQERGAVEDCPGLYFAGLLFQDSFSSMLILGARRDGERVARQIAARSAPAAAA